MSIDFKDGGYKSRKLHLAYVCLGVITLGAAMAARWEAFSALYSTFVGGVIATLSIYSGVNVANKWTNGKIAKAKDNSEAENEDEDGEDEEGEHEQLL